MLAILLFENKNSLFHQKTVHGQNKIGEKIHKNKFRRLKARATFVHHVPIGMVQLKGHFVQRARKCTSVHSQLALYQLDGKDLRWM